MLWRGPVKHSEEFQTPVLNVFYCSLYVVLLYQTPIMKQLNQALRWPLAIMGT